MSLPEKIVWIATVLDTMRQRITAIAQCLILHKTRRYTLLKIVMTRIRSVERGICPIASLNVTN